jgi:hypothetical protein
LNRGALLTPFHNVALRCHITTAADIDLHRKIFAEAARELARAWDGEVKLDFAQVRRGKELGKLGLASADSEGVIAALF